MDQYSCNFCGNTVKYGANHTCSFQTFDSTYSNSQTFIEHASNIVELVNSCERLRLDASLDVREIGGQTEGNAFVTPSSENSESCYRPEIFFREAFKMSPIGITESTGVDDQNLRLSGNSNLIHTTDPKDDEMSRQEDKWLTLNNDEMNFMDSSECVIRTDSSVNSIISGLRNLLVNSDFPSRNNEPENSKKHVSEYVTDGHHSIQKNFNNYNKSEKTVTNVKQHTSKTDNNAVAGPLGVRLKKKINIFFCELCGKLFSTQHARDSHCRSHYREKRFVCKFCYRPFRLKRNLKKHVRNHYGENPYKCPICGITFAFKYNCMVHYNLHK